MAKELVIVESPAKARTMARLLGDSYQVKATLGHVRDLPEWGLGVDLRNNFAPRYQVLRSRKKVLQEIREAIKKAKAVYLATDPDREGEAISWHLLEAANLEGIPTQRIVFHEITKEALEEAFHHPRGIDLHLVNAQQARRILDRLVGYMISPLLWHRVRRGLSAGRVQSAALRMVVEREKEIQGFRPVEYWSLEAELAREGAEGAFRARLISRLGEERKLEIPNEEQAKALVSELERASYKVLSVATKEQPRQPAPPFTTSTLQQEAWRKLRFSAQRTMALAQQLYEGLPLGEEGPVGLITYMRTDSTRVSPAAVAEARDYIAEKYGAPFLPPSPRLFAHKAKGAQEAHEAIRPTSVRRLPEKVKPYLSADQLKLYDLIWKRLVASQMAAALLKTTTVDILAKTAASYLLRAIASVVKFPGFLLLYSEGRDEGEEEPEGALPHLIKGETLRLLGLFPEQHFTQPPPRYTDATLVKALEEKGIGRPSTYAPILSTLQARGYVKRIKGRFESLELGILVSGLLADHFADIVDLAFTAQMEEDLDRIARGEKEWVPMLQEFYRPFEKTVEKARLLMPRIKREAEPTGELCELCGKPLVRREGRYGPFIACSGYPQCKNTKALRVSIGVPCPQCGGEMVERHSKGRLFYGCANYPKCRFSLRQRPLTQPCPRCGSLLILSAREKVKCTKCDYKATFRESAEVKEDVAPMA